MPASSLNEQLEQASLACLQRAAPLLRERARKQPQVEIRCDLRGKAAGQLRRYQDGRLVIRYNLAIARLQPQAFIDETVPHEVAHLLVWLLHGRKARAHGPEWQSMMRYLGIEQPQRCHQFEMPQGNTRRQRRWAYRCDCSEHQISTVRHNRMQRGQSYNCRSCGGLLRPSPSQG